MADLLARDKYQAETASPHDNCTSTLVDDIDLKNKIPITHTENSDSDVDEEDTHFSKENQSVRDTRLNHESSAEKILNCNSSEQRRDNARDGFDDTFLPNGIDSNEESADSSDDTINHARNYNSKITNDATHADHSEKSYVESEVILHKNNDDQIRNRSATESSEEWHILDYKHLNDSGIDITDIETERIMGNHTQSSIVHDKSEVIYDETAPKRIHRPSRLKIRSSEDDSNLLMDGINKLISPDDTGPAKSPTRMRRSGSVDKPLYQTVSKPRPIIVYNEPDEYEDPQTSTKQFQQNHNDPHRSESPLQRHKDDSNMLLVNRIEPHHHYKKSPDMQRKFLSTVLEPTIRSESPVLRMKSKSESSPSTYRKYGRKISSDARLVGGTQVGHSKRQPIRKISSNARLEHVMESVDNVSIPEEEPRSRRVSFGTATYIKHDLNHTTDTDLDKLRHNRYEQSEVYENEANKRNVDNNDLRNGDIRTHTKPHGIEIKETQMNHIKRATTAGFDNKAYIEDENTDHPKQTMKIIDSQTGTSMKVRENIHPNSTIKESSSSESLILFEAAKSMDQNHVGKTVKRLSTHSMPEVSSNAHAKKVFRHSVGVTDSPRSILKVKMDDSVSTGSLDSTTGQRYKIKRDSVSLYHKQNGDAEKRYHGSWVGISRKDLKRLWDSRYDILAQYKVHLIIFIIFLVTLIFVIVGVKLHKPEVAKDSTEETVILDPDFRRIHLFDDEERDEVTGVLGMEIPEGVPATDCYLNFEDESEVKCLSWEEYAELTIVHKVYNNTQCYDVRWILNPGVRLTDCYDTQDAHWYGPVNSSDGSQWPLKSNSFSYDSLFSHVKGTFSTVTEYLWLSSKGVAIIIDPDFPVHVSWNEKTADTICISRSYKESLYPDVLITNRQVKYTICNGVSILETYKFVRDKFFPDLTRLPDFSLLSSPHWSSTSEAVHHNINETVVLALAERIKKHELNCSIIEIDGNWEEKYGDFTFDQNDFKNVDDMIAYMTDSGCELSVKLYPYVNYLSESFKDGLVHGYFVRTAGGKAPALLQWEHGVGAMVDVTGPASRDWFKSKLRQMGTSYNVTTIRFGYGDLLWLPSNSEFYTKNLLPNDIFKIFSRFIDEFGKIILERTSQTQSIPSLISIQSKVIDNGEHKCLKNIIPEVLIVGMLGYPFVISDGLDIRHLMDNNNEELPSEELFIRWMQLSSFFPAMKYTVKPWQYGEDAIMMSKNLTKFHQETVIDIIQSMKRSILSGEPIIRPMWWTDPKDETTFTIDDQFLIGNNMIVAPVLCEGNAGVAERNVYIPKGIWRDRHSKALIQGPKWIRYYRVKQDQMAIFTREVLFEHV